MDAGGRATGIPSTKRCLGRARTTKKFGQPRNSPCAGFHDLLNAELFLALPAPRRELQPPMDQRTEDYAGYRHATVEPQQVPVTRWSAQLLDPQVERDFRVDRFAEDQRRVMLLMVLASVVNACNFALQFHGALADGSDTTLLPALATVFMPLLAAAIISRVRSPGMLEGLMAAFIVVGMFTRMTIMTVYPATEFLWATLIVSLIFIIYIYLPVRLAVSVALATGFSLMAPVWWFAVAGSTLPFEQMSRALVWLVFANALGFIAANSVQRATRERYAQSILLKELHSTDAMTGIGNRRRFDDAFEREWRRCSRSGKPLSLLMIDVDHFKAYNDHYGHLHGDDCLRQVASLLVASIGRPGDLVARYGGEEFVALFPETGEEGARAVAAKIMMALARAATRTWSCLTRPS